jgi:hypothetical protein
VRDTLAPSRPAALAVERATRTSVALKVKRAHGILIDSVTWQNFARCTTADHTECLQVEPADAGAYER